MVFFVALFGYVSGCLAMGFAPNAHGDDWYPYYNEDEYTEFYTPPNPLPPGEPGDLVRAEPSRLVLEPSGQLGAIMATGTRIMYRSTDARGNPDVVTGTYFEPYNDWPGQGPRPLIVYGPGTQGQGDQCAPSRQFNQGIHWSPYLDITFNYEELFVATMVARGFAIVMTDYEGLGTLGTVHTYVNRLSQGHAMLDAARAARLLPDTSLTPGGPMAFWGYSQGGGAAASAAELAPQLRARPQHRRHLRRRAAGRPGRTACPTPTAARWSGWSATRSTASSQSYPEAEPAIRSKLTPRGEDLLFKVKDQCIAETIAKFMFRHLQPYFNEPISDLMQRGDLQGPVRPATDRHTTSPTRRC